MISFLFENILLVLIAVVSAGMLIYPYFVKSKMGATVNNEELTALINKKQAQVVDVRSRNDFKRGTIAGAKNIPASSLQERMSDIKKDMPVILIDDDTKLVVEAAKSLRENGFKDVYVLNKGINGWLEASLPLNR